jgi:hypothetical protein
MSLVQLQIIRSDELATNVDFSGADDSIFYPSFEIKIFIEHHDV